ncbi:MAG TPA: hypothetical protein VFV38_36225 [Ktedonobacteraceae bacterium]|nr:hypothetical protein [Ktedonobacteraceae bacterium]
MNTSAPGWEREDEETRMSQQEFEPRHQRFDEETYQPHYPYTWSEQAQREGMPRDELPLNYSAQQSQYDTPGQAQVPWWARPQPQQNGPFAFAAIVAIVVVIVLILGALGILGGILGGLGHLLGVLLGIAFALLIFVFLLVFLVLNLIGRMVRRALRPLGMADYRTQRRSWYNYRRMARRAARRSWRGRW